ncbi:hypothetical protein NQZ68_009889 [Dissostichus eleginoides]|nr:hypothetical protein NQZ68_009889 [Dissostichus eleginoides]
MGGAERAEPLMERTYVILRRYLNRMPAPAMLEVKEEWPFLFSQRGLFFHFGLLTDVNILQKLQEALGQRGQTILQFCQTLDNPKIREVLASYEPEASEKAACILLLLMVYFKEPTEKLMLEVDTCATAADVVNTAALPSTPCLIIQGDTMKPSGWMLSIEGQVIMGPHPFLLHGIAALFSSYYVFNLEYPVGSCTLEFIQRCFLGINPEKGSKAKKRSSINPHSGKISADSFQKSFSEWEAFRFEVENICKEESFICPACTPDMLAVSVDGNRKHYRFKHAARSEEKATFEGVFIAKDEEVTRFVDYIQRTTKHVSGRGVCGREWSAARETSQRSTSKVDEEGLELAVKWSGAYQEGAGLTLGEEVEQCNAFLSRIAVTTKHMTKAGRTDMLTLLAMRWNQQKFKNVATSLCHRYQKATKALQNQLQNLETMKVQMAVTESKLEDWVNDVKESAEAAKTTTNSNDADALASRIEVLVASIKRRSQRLYKDTDGSKGRARIRRKIRTEKGILTSVVENSVDLKTKRKAFDIIMAIRRLQEKKIVVTEMDHHWKALKACADSLKELSCLLPSEPIQNLPWSLSEERLKGVQSIVFRKRQNISEMKTHTRACYLQVLSGAENINFLQSASSEDFDSDSDLETD